MALRIRFARHDVHVKASPTQTLCHGKRIGNSHDKTNHTHGRSAASHAFRLADKDSYAWRAGLVLISSAIARYGRQIHASRTHTNTHAHRDERERERERARKTSHLIGGGGPGPAMQSRSVGIRWVSVTVCPSFHCVCPIHTYSSAMCYAVAKSTREKP